MVDLSFPWWHVPMFIVMFYMLGFYALVGLLRLYIILPKRAKLRSTPIAISLVVYTILILFIPFVMPPWYVYHKFIKKDIKGVSKALTVDWDQIQKSNINILKDKK